MFFKSSASGDYLLVGLGNIGTKYENTRHNAGFCAVDSIIKEYPPKKTLKKWNGELFFSEIDGKNVIILKPHTYMNLSGDAVSAVMNFYKIPAENIVVISDDISLPVGKIRIRKSGSHGGHNGLKDIIIKIGTDEFKRIKIGVGDRTNPNYDLADWVLSRFSSEEMKTLSELYPKILNAAKLLFDNKVDEAMNKYN